MYYGFPVFLYVFLFSSNRTPFPPDILLPRVTISHPLFLTEFIGPLKTRLSLVCIHMSASLDPALRIIIPGTTDQLSRLLEPVAAISSLAIMAELHTSGLWRSVERGSREAFEKLLSINELGFTNVTSMANKWFCGLWTICTSQDTMNANKRNLKHSPASCA